MRYLLIALISLVLSGSAMAAQAEVTENVHHQRTEIKADEAQLHADIKQLEADKKAHNAQAVKADRKKIRHDVRKLMKALRHHKHHHHKKPVAPAN